MVAGVIQFYDASTDMWLDSWGEHLHHGFYSTPNMTDHKQAQIDMIDRSLEWSFDKPAHDISIRRLADIGCGVGGSSRYIAQKLRCSGSGISLSQRQVV